MGMLPDTLADCKMYGIEKDNISGRIARQLYQKSTIAVKEFENVELPDSFFDVVVGNVPFDDFKPLDKRYDKHKFVLHDYFFAKTLDKVRPNGVIAFITSKGTMDKQNEDTRRYISQRAELIGAIRLPNNTFSKNAGTQVTTDIIFLKKRDKVTDIVEDWVELAENKDGILINNYFSNHPEMVLGNIEMKSTQYGKEDSVCTPFENANLTDLLDMAIDNLDAEVSKLRLIRNSFFNQKYALEDALVKYYPVKIKEYESAIKDIEQDVKIVKENTDIDNEEKFSTMKLMGKNYNAKENAGKMIIEICSKKTEKEEEFIGEYRGMKMYLEIIAGNFALTLKNNHSKSLNLGKDVYGNITRIDNTIDDFEKELEDHKTKLAELQVEFEKTKVDVEIPFDKEDELNQKLKRLEELNKELGMSENENEIVDENEEQEQDEKECAEEIEQENDEREDEDDRW